MNSLKSVIIGAVALGAAAVAPSAQAHDWHHHHSHWSHHSHGRVVVVSGPRYYYDRPYYYDYYGPRYGYYYDRPVYSSGITFGFGGHRVWFHHR